jgi:peptidoglycan/LPS O-acetylase OafA/YrhL
MSFVVDILIELFGQVLWQLFAEVLFGVGDAATGGRTWRVLAFGAAGLVAGGVSFHFRPTVMIASTPVRYAAIVGLTLAGALFLAFYERRRRRDDPTAPVAGFLCGAAFSLTYALMRRALLP